MAVIRRDLGLCQECLKCDSHTSGTDVDHIKPIADHPDLNPFDPDNLQLLCDKCHQEKTGEEATQRAIKKNIGWMEV